MKRSHRPRSPRRVLAWTTLCIFALLGAPHCTKKTPEQGKTPTSSKTPSGPKVKDPNTASTKQEAPRQPDERNRDDSRRRVTVRKPAPTMAPMKVGARKMSKGISLRSSSMGMLGGHGRYKNKDKADGKKRQQQPQVWRRSKSGTMISKVSVGTKKYLKLEKMRVTVKVDGLRVRTVIDHIYKNPFKHTLQGTFKYTLPPDASISYYAMFVGQQRQQTPRFFSGKAPAPRRLVAMTPQQVVKSSAQTDWGKLREARMVAAVKGREVYERITRRRIDPALVEQEAPNTFSAKVFPIPANGYNRVIIAYEQTLPRIGDEQVYRFRFPDDVGKIIDFSIEHNGALSTLTRNNLRKIRCNAKIEQNFVRCFWEQNKPDRDAVFYFKPKRSDASWVAGTDPISGKHYLVAQLRVDLPAKATGNLAGQALFLLDTSLSENPDHFAVNVALLKRILEKNPSIKRFNLLFFDVGTTWANNKGWIPNTEAARKALFAKVDGLLLEGATDFSTALRRVAEPKWHQQKQSQPVDIFLLSDGQLNWGKRDVDAILAQFKRHNRWSTTRFFAYRTGVGSENTGLYSRLARLGGAVFTCLGQSELDRCATAHTKQAMRLTGVTIDGIDASEILVAGRVGSLYPGALLTLATRVGQSGNAVIKVRGSYLGQPKVLTYNLAVKPQGDLAPRAWAELAVAQLMELNDPKLEKLVVAYSQHFQIPNKHCSLLVLETDAEYKQYGLTDQKKTGRVDDLAFFITKKLAAKGKPLTDRQWITHLLRRGAESSKMTQRPSGRALFALLAALPDASFTLSHIEQAGLISKIGIPKAYLETRGKDRNDFEPFVVEAKRRLAEKGVGGAVRALSSIVELHPADARALRLVGYYLMSWERHAEAAQIFLRVLERRPFEPHSYRDLARALIKLKRYGLAAAMYEVILGGSWRRFNMIHVIAREEYALMMRDALKSRDSLLARALGVKSAAIGRLKSELRGRKTMLGLSVKPSKVRVTVTWNTDNTDIDLHVVEPSGEKCYYSHKRTRHGGVLLQDVTWGYGPERYENVGGQDGKYNVRLKFFGHRSNVLGNETHANVVIVLNAGTAKQRIIEKNLVLKKRQDVVDVTTVSVR